MMQLFIQLASSFPYHPLSLSLILTQPINNFVTDCPQDIMEMPFPNDSDDSVHASQVQITMTETSLTSCHGNFPTNLEELKGPVPDDFLEGSGQQKADGMAFLHTLMSKPEKQT